MTASFKERYFGDMTQVVEALIAFVVANVLCIVIAAVFTVPTGIVEHLAVATTLVCGYLTMKQRIWCWPFGVLSTLLLGFVFLQVNLFSSMALNLAYFLPIQFFGWYRWAQVIDDKSLEVTSLSKTQMWAFTGLGLVGVIVCGQFFSTYTSAVQVYWDATILSGSIIAQYLLTVKKLEAWFVWMGVNVLGIGLYYISGAPLVAAQNALLLFVSVKGFYDWRNEMKNRPIRETGEEG